MITLQHYLILSVLLFVVGAVGVVVRRDMIMMLISVEIMMSGAVVAILAFARWTLLPDGHAVALFAIVVMAAEAVVGACLVVAFFKAKGSTSADDMNAFRE